MNILRTKMRGEDADNLMHLLVIGIKLVSHLGGNPNSLRVTRYLCPTLCSNVQLKITAIGCGSDIFGSLIKLTADAHTTW